MSIKINNISLGLDEDTRELKAKAAKKLKLSEDRISSLNILKESVDARKKDSIKLNYALEVRVDGEEQLVKRLKDKDVLLYKADEKEEFAFGSRKLSSRPVVVGMGPAGMFAALELARNGYRPLVIERGEAVEQRDESVKAFWEKGVLNPESNVQFGEGGAGTFSDGKLTTRIKDCRCDQVLREFVKAGAPEEIVYSGKPHIGTDVLKVVVRNIRREIESLGGTILFSHRLEDIRIENGSIRSITVNGEETACQALLLAIGHSSRDTYGMLFGKGIMLEQKPFAIGVRIEHSQQMINESQYGKFAGHPRLKAADYRLTHTCEATGRGVYSFCMCPGGQVVAAASEEGLLVTNGMSDYSRDKENANSAIVVSVGGADFKDSSPLAGMEFQRHFEKLAFEAGGGGYLAPVQTAGDFLEDRPTSKLGSIVPTYTPGYRFADMRGCLPICVIESLKDGLIHFNKKIKNFSDENSILTGIETRTSAPLRILRNQNFQSANVAGLFPSGEGAGFAGGIISSAVDGMKSAEWIMKEFSA
jgi:hypothetical protein